MLVSCQWYLKNNDENLVTSIGLTMIGVRQAGSHVSEMLKIETRRDKTTTIDDMKKVSSDDHDE